MSTESELLRTLIATGKRAGMDQRALALRAGIAPETISRAKKQGRADLSTVLALSKAVGLELHLRPTEQPETPTPKHRSSLANPVWGLAWSNSHISDDVLVRNALLKGSFLVILEAVLEHGITFVQDQWALLLRTPLPPPPPVQANVQRILSNIERGLAHAQA